MFECPICFESDTIEQSFDPVCRHSCCLFCFVKIKKKECPWCRESLETIKGLVSIHIFAKKWQGLAAFRNVPSEDYVLTVEKVLPMGDNRILIQLNKSTCLGLYCGNGPTSHNSLMVLAKNDLPLGSLSDENPTNIEEIFFHYYLIHDPKQDKKVSVDGSLYFINKCV